MTALTLVASTALLGASGAHADDGVDCGAFRTELRQLVNPTSEASLLTRWGSEAETARDLYGFTVDLGVLARAASQPGDGLVPVWRLYRAGDFVWATDGADADDFVAGGYRRQFVEFYASPDPAELPGLPSTASSVTGCTGSRHGPRPRAWSPTAG